MTSLRKLFSRICLTAIFLLLPLCVASTIVQARQSVRRGFAKVNNAKLYYEVSGKGHPLVLIHGGNMDMRMWDMQFNVFAKAYKVIRYDVHGFGKSDVPTKGFSHTQDLYSLLKFLHVDRAYIIGLSLGGRIAIDFALEHPEMVDALVLAAPGLSGYRFSDESRERSWATIEAARDEGFAKATEMWLKSPYMSPAMKNPAIKQRLQQLALENAHHWLENPYFERETKPPATQRLSQIHVPTLLIVGDRDIPDIQKIVDTLATGIAGAKKQIIHGAGHIINMENPEEFNQAMQSFLDSRGTF